MEDAKVVGSSAGCKGSFPPSCSRAGLGDIPRPLQIWRKRGTMCIHPPQEAIAIRLEAIALRLEAIASRLEAIVGWRPSLVGWRQLLFGRRPSLVGWRPSLVTRFLEVLLFL